MTNQQKSVTKHAYVSTRHHPLHNFQFEPQMVRTVNRVEDDEIPDSSSPTESKRVARKGNTFRSKHSETEQRRRSKINERFQILRDLIPDNDQKRDKASFLLEVIGYIQFLKEKVHTYEGSCPGWSPEPVKLTPPRVNSGQFERYIDQSHIENHLPSLEDNVVLNPALVSEVQNSLLSNFTGASLYKPTVNPQLATNPCLHNMPVQPPFFEGVPGQLHKGSVLEAEQLAHQSRSDLGKSCTNDFPAPLYSASEEELKSVNGEASISSAYSQGLLNSLTGALQSSGVDLSKANISVQLDIGKRTKVGTAETMFNIKDQVNSSELHALTPGDIGENYEHLHKRFRAEQS